MDNRRTNASFLRLAGLCAVFLLISFSLTGCEPLRKKFIRKKKEQKQQEVIPVLDPQQYPPAESDPTRIYCRSYSLWQVWFKDLMVALAEQDSDKRLIHISEQLELQLENMQPLLPDEQQTDMQSIRQAWRDFRAEFDKPSGLRSRVALENRARRIDRDLRQHFSCRRIKSLLNPQAD